MCKCKFNLVSEISLVTLAVQNNIKSYFVGWQPNGNIVNHHFFVQSREQGTASFADLP